VNSPAGGADQTSTRLSVQMIVIIFNFHSHALKTQQHCDRERQPSPALALALMKPDGWRAISNFRPSQCNKISLNTH
jgi:hypothetical protein